MSNENISNIAAKGIELAREISRLEKELSGIKDELREGATALLEEGESSVFIESPAGTVQVSFRDDREYVKAGDVPKVSKLRQEMPPKKFSSVFEEKVSYNLQKGWELSAAAMDEAEEAVIRSLISATTYSPAVSFPK